MPYHAVAYNTIRFPVRGLPSVAAPGLVLGGLLFASQQMPLLEVIVTPQTRTRSQKEPWRWQEHGKTHRGQRCAGFYVNGPAPTSMKPAGLLDVGVGSSGRGCLTALGFPVGPLTISMRGTDSPASGVILHEAFATCWTLQSPLRAVVEAGRLVARAEGLYTTTRRGDGRGGRERLHELPPARIA